MTLSKHYKYVLYYYYSYYLTNLENQVIISLESEIMDGFWHSRCLHDCTDLTDMIGTLASGANAFFVAKNGTTIDKSSPEDRFWCLRCLYDCINLFYMIGSLASGANAS